MQFGTPVVAVDEGGFRETIVEGESGVFFDEPTPEGVRRGIEDLRSQSWNRPTMMAQASLFSTEAFNERIRSVVKAAGELVDARLHLVEHRAQALGDRPPFEALEAGSGAP